MKTYAAAWCAALLVLSGPACSRRDDAAAGPQPKRHALTGEVISADPGRNVLVVKHDPIPGLMPAMTMEFGVTPGDARAAKPGQRIRAQMIEPAGNEEWRLEQIWPDDAASAAAVKAKADALRQETLARGRSAYREIGERAPDFALYNQNGEVVESGRFRGKKVMLNFIFTRCPVATMCPAATVKMTTAQKLAREQGVTNLEFVSITLDPAYDTPGVLKEYADTRGIDTSNFSFLTGPENAIKDLLANFGVLAEFEGDLLKHTLATILIDEQGRVIHRSDTSAWEPAEFAAKMKR
ncbi:MAG TPA: SCO family protein [Opitutus sp.]|nr:SCO family protein [Opitutus sp.]